MKLSTKLKLSFGAMILVTTLLFTGTIIAILNLNMYMINQKYDTGSKSYDVLTNVTRLVSDICDSEYQRLVTISQESPDLFDGEPQIFKIDDDLNEKGAFLVVIIGDEVSFCRRDYKADFEKELAKIEYNNGDHLEVYIGDPYQVLVKPVEFTMTNGTEGKAFVVMELNKMVPHIKHTLTDVVIAFIVILILTSGILVAWIYKSTVNPINNLRIATQNIKDGNLDFEMNTEGDTEISDLCRDFDEMRKRLKENAEEKLATDSANKLLVSNISHDLKTPLTAIKGYCEGIMDGVAGTPEKLDKYIRTIYNKACDMDKLINELTFYSQVDADSVIYNFVKLNVEAYFDDCVEELGLDLNANGITVDYNKNIDSDVEVIADPEQLKRVISNIVSNSVKYMDKSEGKIIISIYEEKSLVKIDIQDNGSGIDEKDIPHIFDRFYRSDSSRNQAKGGSGIGLSIVKKIIADHSGMVMATSVIGEGTTMHILLPKYIEAEQSENVVDD